jgi:hypothetical protein
MALFAVFLSFPELWFVVCILMYLFRHLIVISEEKLDQSSQLTDVMVSKFNTY